MTDANAQPRTYTIDLWEQDSIWTWEGIAHSDEEAQALALAEINNDWSRDWSDWDDMAADIDGTGIIEHPTVMAARQPLALITAYQGLAEGLREMIENGRLGEGDIPDDFVWLQTRLAQIVGLEAKP